MRLKLSKTEMSPALTELLLYTFNKKGMHKEIIDLCQDSQNSDIMKYYLAESVLQGQLKDKTYTEALRDCGVYTAESDLAPCQLTQRTKALFLEGSDKGAIDFLRSEIDRREERARERKELLVAMYDSTLKEQKNKKLSFKQFKERHQKSALFSKRLIA